LEIDIRIGIATGDVVVGSIGLYRDADLLISPALAACRTGV
jgi:class 3 adenylate cyclase